MTNDNQQTAIDEFIEQLEQKGGAWENANINRIQISIDVNEYLELKRQAKEMEKKRLMNAFDEGQEYEYQYHVNSTPKFDAETWYNETYGGNK